jgi:endonuclease I
VLHSVIAGHRQISYSAGATNTEDALKVLDEDPANTNNVVLIYSGFSVAKTNFGLSTGWNREHLWANSYGLDMHVPAYSDLHNLRAVDSTVNSARGNKFYDKSDVHSPSFRSPASAEAPLTTTDSDSWEPPDSMKGDIARALFYMAVRYTGVPTNETFLFLTDDTAQISGTTNLMGRLSTLLVWNLLDPVDTSERRRNDLVYELYQRNRNPFVDHPEWVEPAFLPALVVRAELGVLKIHWAGEFIAAVLEMRPIINAPWTIVPGVPVAHPATATSGPTLEMSVPFPAQPSLFRLRLP